MAAPPALLDAPFAPSAPSRSGVVGWLVGGAAALTATLVAGVVALLFAAALAVVALLALVLAALALALWKVRGRRKTHQVLAARWTGYGWDAR